MGNVGGSGGYVNLIVREVRVTPVRAHVGDTIRVDAVIENVGDGRGTTSARVYAGTKPVASRLFTYGEAGEGERVYRETFFWDTKGAAAGEYRIRAEVFLWEDAAPFDNELAVADPVTLLATGAAFPAGQAGGGEAVAVDPRWHPERQSPGPGSGNPRPRPAS